MIFLIEFNNNPIWIAAKSVRRDLKLTFILSLVLIMIAFDQNRRHVSTYVLLLVVL